MPLVPALPPAAEQVQPITPDAAYAQGVAARRAGRDAEAAALLAGVVRARPDHVDARLNLGLALLALDRLDEAERELEAVVERAPAYADAHLALARIAQRRGDRPTAQQRLARTEALQPGGADAAALRAALERGSEPRWRLDMTVAESDLSGGLSPWRETTLSLTRRLDDRTSVGASVEHTERFGRSDTYLEAVGGRRFGWGGGYVALGGTPDADYRPELALRGGLEAPVGGGFAATLDGSVARFPVGTIRSLQPGLQWTGLSERLTLGARWINTWDETGERQDGYAVRGALTVHPRLTLRAGFADAPETSEGVTTQVVSRSLGVEFGLTERLTLRLNGVDEDRGAYDRREIGVGLGWRF